MPRLKLPSMPVPSIGTARAVSLKPFHFVTEAMREPIKYPSNSPSKLIRINGSADAAGQDANPIATGLISKGVEFRTKKRPYPALNFSPTFLLHTVFNRMDVTT